MLINNNHTLLNVPNMPQFKKSAYVLLFSICIISCSDQTTIFENPEDNFSIENNEQVLGNSLNFANSGVIDIIRETNSTTTNSTFNEKQAGDYPLTLVAQIVTPSFSGLENLTASDVHIDGDYAYVSYNTVGEDYGGAADIIFIGDPNEPRVVSRVIGRALDLNAITFDDDVYLVGGLDAEQSTVATANSVIIRIDVLNNRFNIPGGLAFAYQEGFTANDVVATANSVFMTSGGDGYITEFENISLDIINEAAYTDLRSVVINNDKPYVLDADFGVRVLNEDFTESTQIPISSNFGVAERRTLDVFEDRIIVSEGNNGAGVYNLNSGAFIEHIPITTNPANVTVTDIVTNAVSFNEDAILMANGGGGLSFSKFENGTIATVGVIELPGSINFVSSKGDFIFAASGSEGLQIIRINRPSPTLAAECADLPNYEGSANLNVNGGEDLAFSGKKSFDSLNINGNLLLCGSWTSRNSVNINSSGAFSIRGSLFVGNNNDQRSINVNNGAKLIIEGDVTIYGDLNLRDNTTLEFLGEDSQINVFGNVNVSNSATITGTFDDVQGKF